jgi:zinc protease
MHANFHDHSPIPSPTLPLKGRETRVYPALRGVASAHPALRGVASAHPVPPLSRGRLGGGWGAVFHAKFIVLAFCLVAPMAHAALDVQQWRTANGARVYLVANHDLPMLDVSVSFEAGSARDSAATAGLSGMTHSLMRLGAGGMNEQQIAERLADVGAVLAQSQDADRAGFSLRTLSSPAERETALTVLRAVLSRPHFDAAVLKREQARAIAGLQDAETQPEFLAARAFNTRVFGAHPYGINETAETLARVTAPQLAAFHQQYYRAANLTVVLMGDIDRQTAEAVAHALSQDLPPGEAAAKLPVVPPRTTAEQVVIPHHATQSHLVIGLPGMSRDDPDYFPLLVGNYILGGGGFDSRLMHEIRDQRGLSYSVHSYFMPLRQRGEFQIGLQTRRDATDEALAVVRATVQRYLDSGPTAAELAQAQANLIGSFPLRLDSNKKIVEHLAMLGFYGLPLSWLDDYPRRVAAVSLADIQRAFRARVVPGQMVTVIVGGQRGGK